MIKVKAIHHYLWELLLEKNEEKGHEEEGGKPFTLYDVVHHMPVGVYIR